MPVESSDFTLACCSPQVFAQCAKLHDSCYTRKDPDDEFDTRCSIEVVDWNVNETSRSLRSKAHNVQSTCPDYTFMSEVMERIQREVNNPDPSGHDYDLSKTDGLNELAHYCLRQVHKTYQEAPVDKSDPDWTRVSRPLTMPEKLQISLIKKDGTPTTWTFGFYLGYKVEEELEHRLRRGSHTHPTEAVFFQVVNHLVKRIRPCSDQYGTEQDGPEQIVDTSLDLDDRPSDEIPLLEPEE